MGREPTSGQRKINGSGKRRDRRIQIKRKKIWKFCGRSGEVKDGDLFSGPGNILDQNEYTI